MASGTNAAFDAAKPILDATAETVFRLGDAAGSGSAIMLQFPLHQGPERRLHFGKRLRGIYHPDPARFPARDLQIGVAHALVKISLLLLKSIKVAPFPCPLHAQLNVGIQ